MTSSLPEIERQRDNEVLCRQRCDTRDPTDTGIFGVCDGHGPFGHLASFRVSQSFPHFLLKAGNGLLLQENPEVALQNAFFLAAKDLLQFGEEEHISFDSSGSTLSVAICTGQTVHMGTTNLDHIWDRACSESLGSVL